MRVSAGPRGGAEGGLKKLFFYEQRPLRARRRHPYLLCLRGNIYCLFQGLNNYQHFFIL